MWHRKVSPIQKIVCENRDLWKISNSLPSNSDFQRLSLKLFLWLAVSKFNSQSFGNL